jgi:hypothetical protein
MPIRLLVADANERGDLFARLMQDLFHSLGYEDTRLNIQKAGREIDLAATHSVEPKRVVAECKATESPVGGNDLNKFFGALDAERRSLDAPETVGYFVSLGGFRETAIEQEKNVGSNRLILMDGQAVVEQLIKGRIIASPQQAIAQAAACTASYPKLRLDTRLDLLAHQIGWIWAVYFGVGAARTHYVLVHADGGVLHSSLVKAIQSADKAVGGKLSELQPIVSTEPPVDISSQEAIERYLQYVDREYGEITLEGLPADQEVGSRRLKLENLFVPLELEPLESKSAERRRLARKRVGPVIAQHPRIAVLAPPGGGKSTLLKRLAVAYAIPDRLGQADDKLPKRNWLPLVIRCRHLGNLVTEPLFEAISRWLVFCV